MEETIEKYDPLKLETLKRLLERDAAKGRPRYYEIIIDNLKVVERTNDPAEFDGYEEFLYEGTKELKVNLYTHSPASPRIISSHRYNLQKEEKKPETLNGLDIEAKINEKVTEKVSLERERWDCDQVRRELETTKGKLTEANEYIEKLQTAIQHYKSKKLHLGDINLGELTSVVLEGMIRRNPQLLAKIPGGAGLAGVIEQDNKEKQQGTQPQPEGEATFKKKEEATLTEDEKRYLHVLREMEEEFDDEQIRKVLSIVQLLSEDTARIDKVLEFLGNTSKGNAKQQVSEQP